MSFSQRRRLYVTRPAFGILAVLFTAMLGACGGGGGSAGSSGGITPSGPTPCPSGYQGTAPNCSAYTNATFSGSVVDYASGAPLAGVQVALAPWATPSPWAAPSPIPVATTDASGSFAGTASPGPYLLVIGSDSVTDARATVHQYVSLHLGPNTLKAPGPTNVYNWTLPASESSGKFRLMTLDRTIQTSCLNAINSRREALGLQPVIPDEWLEETSYDVGEAFINNGGGSWVLKQAEYNIAVASSCDDMLMKYDFAPASDSYNLVTSPYLLWFGGAYIPDPVATRQSFALEQLAYDPRIAVPCTGSATAFTPGPGQCQPAYSPWPGQAGGYPTPPPTPTPPPYPPVYTAEKPQSEPPGSKLSYGQNQLRDAVGFDGGRLIVNTNGWDGNFYIQALDSSGTSTQVVAPSNVDQDSCSYDATQKLWCMAVSKSPQEWLLQPSLIQMDPITGATGSSMNIPSPDGSPNIALRVLFDKSGGSYWAYQYVGSTYPLTVDVTHVAPDGSILSNTPVEGGCSCTIDDLSFDPSGNIWGEFNSDTRGDLAEIASTGGVIARYLPYYFSNQANNASTTPPAFDPQGNMWLVGDRRFDKVSPSGQILTTVGVQNSAYVALQALVDANGTAWLLSDYTGSPYLLTPAVLTEVSPAGAVIANYYLGSTLYDGITYGTMALDPSGRLWVLLDGSTLGSYQGLTATIYTNLAAGPQFSTTVSGARLPSVSAVERRLKPAFTAKVCTAKSTHLRSWRDAMTQCR